MSIKDELLAVVRAFNTLINSQANSQALADAQAKIADLTAAQTLTDAEQAEVDKALATASAATPPTPAAVTAVQAGVTGSTGN